MVTPEFVRHRMDSENRGITIESGDPENARKFGAVSLPGVGYLSKPAYACGFFEKWPTVLREKTVHHHTGEQTRLRTVLVGVDSFSRLLYLDENNELLVVAPKHHRAFRRDEEFQDGILRGYPPEHGGGDGHIINAPNNDVIGIVKRKPVSGRFLWDRDFHESFIDMYNPDHIAALSDEALSEFQSSTLDETDEFIEALTVEQEEQEVVA